MRLRTLFLLPLSSLAVVAFAQVHSVAAIGAGVSNTTLPKQDVFVTTGYTAGGATFDASSFQRWHDGSLTNNVGTYGWNQSIPTETGNAYSGNPDRGDDAASFNGGASLSNVFSATNKNLNWIIDGESTGYTLDLLYGGGNVLHPASGATSLLVMERGMNSGVRLYGLYRSGASVVPTTSYVDLAASAQSDAGFSIDTTEIGSAQKVGAWGVDVSSLSTATGGNGLLGFRFYSSEALGSNGPDLVGVASAAPVPEPAPVAGLALGALGLLRSRRRARKAVEAATRRSGSPVRPS